MWEDAGLIGAISEHLYVAQAIYITFSSMLLSHLLSPSLLLNYLLTLVAILLSCHRRPCSLRE